MTFRQLALSNLRGRALRYAAFFLSSVFSVTLFFLYAQFIFHPDVTGGYIYGGEGARMALIVCEVLIVVFSFFFVLYSSSAFLKARHQEFGLLTLLGTTRGQLRRLVWLENTFLSLGAIGAGIGLGLLFSKLFLMALTEILLIETPIRFLVLPQALAVTAVGFFVLFQVITLVSVTRLGRRSVKELLEESRKPKPQPRASLPLAILALLLIAAGYTAAALVDTMWIVIAFLPVVGVVTLGTFLLFGQASVYLLGQLKRNRRYYLSGPRLLVISQLVFRMKDNARLLASVATMSAVVLSAAGTFYIMSSQLVEQNRTALPDAVSIVERPDAGEVVETAGPDAADIGAILERHGIEPYLEVHLPAVEIWYQEADASEVESAALISESSYRAVVDQAGRPVGSLVDAEEAPPVDSLPALQPGERWLIDPWHAIRPEVAGAPEEARIQPLGAEASEIVWTYNGRLVTPVGPSGPWLVAPDSEFERRYQEAEPGERLLLHAYDWRNWTRTAAVNDEISALVAAGDSAMAAERWTNYQGIRQILGLSLFMGLFISLLFFIGAGSMIYFKLFTELPDDRKLFASLRRIGITAGEVTRTVLTQVALIFFLPFLVGALHALFALNTLGNLVSVNVLGYSLIVVGMFALVQALFFGLTQWTYLRTLRPA